MSQRYILPNVDYGRDLDAYISKNFQYWEFVSSKKAVELGIANVPTEAEWQRIEFLVKYIVQPLRDKKGRIRVSSAFRCKALNDANGSTDTSFHRLGCAVDLEPLECSLMELLEEAYKLPNWSEIIAEYFPNGWLHIAYKENDNRKMLKLKDKLNHYKRVTLDILRKKYGAKS